MATMSETTTGSDADATSGGAINLTTRQRLYVFLIVDVLVLLIVLAIAFL